MNLPKRDYIISAREVFAYLKNGAGMEAENRPQEFSKTKS